jgi:hypothetical protein
VPNPDPGHVHLESGLHHLEHPAQVHLASVVAAHAHGRLLCDLTDLGAAHSSLTQQVGHLEVLGQVLGTLLFSLHPLPETHGLGPPH